MGFKSKLRNLKDCAVNSMIYRQYYGDLDENLVYLESRDGLDFTGNIFRIVEELSQDKYNYLKIYVHAKPHLIDKIKAFQKNYNLRIDKIITKEAEATRILEKAKYIFTDSGIRPKYVKKEGQIFVNTWHGTPLKRMGRDNTAEEHRIGNVQHSLLSSDYLIFPSKYMMNTMLKSYDIDKIYPGTVLFEGYPRNSVFLDESSNLKEELGYSDYEIFAYMPTFRGIFMDRNEEGQRDDVEKYLTEIDLKLSDKQILFAKLHVLNASKIDFSKFTHIRPFPEGYETYDVLNMADVLITDYSSVFFDFANTRKKIILFTYDEDDYISYRGFYHPLSHLPFPKVHTTDELICELNCPKNYKDNRFVKKYCTFDRPGAVENLCAHIFTDEYRCYEYKIENDKPNILIFAGALYKFGIASSLFNLLNNVNKNRYNFFITFKQWEENIIEEHESIFKLINRNIGILPLRFNLTPTVREKLAFNKYFLSDKEIEMPEDLKRLFKRSFDKQYGSIDFDLLIDFDGYNHEETLLFINSGCDTAVWVHNDMLQEINCKHNQNPLILKEAYSKAKHLCVVSPSLIEPSAELAGRRDHIKVIHNFNNYRWILRSSKMDLKLDENTRVFNNDIRCVLNKDVFKFISVGRFSPEKGHKRLIEAFNEFCKDYPDSQLIIIGGYGSYYDETCRLIESVEYGKNITLILNISNPMPILGECDLFILSSYYEGWPMVLMEADTLCLPIISTDISATRAMGDYAGVLVENSKEGLLKGMHDFVDAKIRCVNSDFESYNKNARKEFLELLKN